MKKKSKKKRHLKIKTGDLSDELVAAIDVAAKEWTRLAREYEDACKKCLTPVAAEMYEDPDGCEQFIQEDITPDWDDPENTRRELILYARRQHLDWLEQDLKREREAIERL